MKCFSRVAHAHLFICKENMTQKILTLLFSLFLLFYSFSSELIWLYKSVNNYIVIPSVFLIAGLITVVCFLIVVLKDANLKKCSINALFLTSGAVLFSIFTFDRINFPQIDVALLLISLYGVYGMLLTDEKRWQRGLPIALLIAVCIPFAVDFGSGFGFFLRIASSKVVGLMLQLTNIPVMSSHDILIFENGMAQVDTPCSGLKSLFTGTLFFLSAAFIRKRQLSAVLCFQYLVFCCVMVAANVLRIFFLAILYEIVKWKQFADLLHIPLGVAFFIGVCGVGWLLLGFSFEKGGASSSIGVRKCPLWVGACVLLLSLCLSIMLKTSSVPPSFAKSYADQNILSELGAKEVGLEPIEKQFFTKIKNTNASKWRFMRKGITGELLVIETSMLNGIHSPEVCFVGNGMNISSVQEMDLGSISCTVIGLDDDSQFAVFWLQHAESSTRSFLVRFWRHVIYGEKLWSLKVVLLAPGNRVHKQAVNELLFLIYKFKNPKGCKR